MKSPSFSITISFRGRKNIPSLVKCIKSFYNQSYLPKEIILVGNKDDLFGIDKRLPDKHQCRLRKVFVDVGKNEARNIGIKAASGDFVIYADHDMHAAGNLLESCYNAASKYDVLFIPERGAGGNFWANCRKLQKEFIQYDLDTVSPRFFRKSIFSPDEQPFNSDFGELDEWGFNLQIVKKNIPIGIVDSYFLVTEHNLTLSKEIRSKFKRGIWMPCFYKVDKNEAWRRVDPIKRGIIFYSKRINYLFTNPIFFLGVLFFKTVSLLAFFSGAFVGFLFRKGNKTFLKEQTKNLNEILSGRYLFDMYESTNWNRYVDLREKRAVMKIWDLDNESIIKKQKILDSGVGPGRWSEFFLKYNFSQVVGLDISPKMVIIAKKRINNGRFKAVVGDIEKLPFPRNSFDKIFCFRTFKYSPNPLTVLKEARRVVKKNGLMLLEVSNRTLMNILLVGISRFINMLNPELSLESRWGYYLRTNFYSQEGIKHLAKLANLKVVNYQALFILPSITLPGSDKFVWFWRYLDELLFFFLPRAWFARSWLFLLEK